MLVRKATKILTALDELGTGILPQKLEGLKGTLLRLAGIYDK